MRPTSSLFALVSLLVQLLVSAEAQSASLLTVDIDCDGKRDKVSLTQNRNSATVRVVFGNTSHKPAEFTFIVSASRQDAICGLPAQVESESLDYDPTEAVGEIPGFRSSKTCKAFALVGGECDSIHFYWNHLTRRLEWWRL